jgi:CHAT domain-containing protein
VVLAGANVLSSGPGEDGMLTAAEAINLDLRGTELVVVSACNSALGDIHPGDGVYGLRRAILAAGARSEVMTLWEIDDAPSAELIVAFYGHLLTGESVSSALRNAQLEFAPKSNPSVWAAFLSIGRPAGLSPQLLSLVRKEER